MGEGKRGNVAKASKKKDVGLGGVLGLNNQDTRSSKKKKEIKNS